MNRIHPTCLSLALPALTALFNLSAPTSTPSTQPTTSQVVATQPVALSVADADALTAAVGKRVRVSGVVAKAQLSSTGKVFRIEFTEARTSGFVAVVFERNLRAVTDGLGSDLSKALEGKHIEIAGTLEPYKSKPELVIADPSQVKFLPD